MNKREKECREALKELNKAAKEGIKKISKENAFLFLRLYELRETLRKIEKLKVLGLSYNVEQLEKKLKNYEGVLDKKYWNEDALFYISASIVCNVYTSLEEAIAGYKEYKKLQQ